MALDRNEIENFLYREARLMDEHQYDEWEALWTDDAIYWVPCGGEDTDPTKDVSIIYDDRARIAGRLVRLKSGAAWAQDPQSRLRRVVSNIEAYEEDDGSVTVYSNFALAEVRRRSVDTWQEMWVGRTTHKLRREDGSLKMSYKKVALVNNDTEIPSLWILV